MAFMCFVWISEQTAITFLYSINWLVFATETESVYCAVRTSSSYIKHICFIFKGLITVTKFKAKYAVFLLHKEAVPYQKFHVFRKEHSAYTAISVASVAFFSLQHMATISVLCVSGNLVLRQSLWPCGLRYESAAARLLGLRVRIPRRTWMYVSCRCCMLSGRGFYVGLITSPEESYRMWCVWVWSWSLENEKALAQ
jgi:hypothetical protein